MLRIFYMAIDMVLDHLVAGERISQISYLDSVSRANHRARVKDDVEDLTSDFVDERLLCQLGSYVS